MRFKEYKDDWIIDDIGNVISIDCPKYNPLKGKNIYPCIELDNLDQETGILLNTYNSKNQNSIKNKFEKENILYGKLRPYLKKYFYPNFEGVCSTEIWVMKSIKLLPKWIYYFVQTDYFSNLTNISSGSKMPRADWNYIKNELIYYPKNSQEAMKIADMLETIDKRIQTQIKIIEDYIYLNKCIINELIINLEEYTECYISDIAKIGRGRVISSKEINKQLKPIYPVYSSQTSKNGIMGYLDQYEFDGEYITWTTDGANAGTVYYRNGKFNCTNVCGTLKINKENDTFFVSKVLSCTTSSYVSKNLANPKLMNNVMAKIKIKLPSLDKQREFSKIIKSIEKKIKYEKDLLDLLKSQKNYFLKNLFI